MCEEMGTQTEDSEQLAMRFETQGRQLDALHREAGDKGRELRKAQDTIATLRRELHQERDLVECYREQVEVLEQHLANALQKQRNAEDERTVAEWRLRTAAGHSSLSRSCTPQPSAKNRAAWADNSSDCTPVRCASARGMARDSDPWAEAREQVRPSSGRGGRGPAAPPARPLSRQYTREEELMSDSSDAMPEVSGNSDDELSGDDDPVVFHPPPVGPTRYK